jgi:hypothetical protein
MTSARRHPAHARPHSHTAEEFTGATPYGAWPDRTSEDSASTTHSGDTHCDSDSDSDVEGWF